MTLARGFDSKSVTDQQEAAFGRVEGKSEFEGGDPRRVARRRSLELAKIDVERKLKATTHETHRRMLEKTLAALEQELSDLT